MSGTVVQEPRTKSTGINNRILLIAVVLILLAVTGGVFAILASHPPTPSGNDNSTGNNGSSKDNSNGSNHNSQSPPMRFQRITATDPKVFSSTFAFTMMIPEGWTASAVVERYKYPFGGADFNFTATDLTGTRNIFFTSADWPYFMEYTGTDWSGQTCVAYDASSQIGYNYARCAQGTWWLPPGYVGERAFVHDYMTAQQYIRAVSNNQLVLASFTGVPPPLVSRPLWPILKTVHPDVSLENIIDNPNLAQRVITVTATQTSGAEALFDYTNNGVQYKYALQILVVRYTYNIAGFYLSEWNTFAWGYSAPSNGFSSTGRIFSMIVPNVKVNLQWLQAEIQRMGNANQLIAQHNERMLQMQLTMFKSLEQSQFQTGQGWIDALGGVKEIVNPNDSQDTYRVPYDYTYWWYCGGSADPFVGTNDSLYNPQGCTRYPDKPSS